MSYLLGLYKIIRKLGRGGFGQVYLVIDQNEKQWAVKQINKKRLGSDSQDYIYNEIKILKQFNSEYIAKLQAFHQTNQYIYIVLEYCNGRDLKNEMGNRKDKIFSLKQAAEILSDAIRGLQVVHKKGYLHRDVKIQNILVHTDEDGKKKYKIADFGLSKASAKGETVLGTGSYMSPEYFKNQQYGFEVDMWAFGVTLYFMLNKDFPFKLNPHIIDSLQLQYQQLVRQAKDFSYAASVSKSKYKIKYNCTPQVQDLFKRMFQLNPDKRITFSQIRQHSIFKEYFPQKMAQQSKIMYKKNPKVKDNFTKGQQIYVTPIQNQNVELKQSVAFRVSETQKFPKQKQFLFHRNNQIEFLYNNYKQFSDVHGVLTLIEKMPLCYNILKYYIILKKTFIELIKSGKISQKETKYAFNEYLKTQNSKKQLRQFQQQLQNATQEFQTLHDQCSDNIELIKKVNEKFQASYNNKIVQTDFVDPLKSSYRKSTLLVFNKLRKFLKQNNTGNKYNYFLAIAVISHIFNRLFIQKQNAAKVFKDFLQQQKTTIDLMNFDKLRQWMSKASPMQLNAVTRNIITKYFENA